MATTNLGHWCCQRKKHCPILEESDKNTLYFWTDNPPQSSDFGCSMIARRQRKQEECRNVANTIKMDEIGSENMSKKR